MGGLKYCFAAVLFVVILSNIALALPPKGNDEDEIRTLEQNLVAAVKAKNSEKVMACYAPGEELFVFDVVPPRQYASHDAYKKDWKDVFAQLQGPMNIEISDLHVTANSSDLAFSRSIQHITGTFIDGKPLDLIVR